MRGTGNGAELWGLIMVPSFPLHAKQEVKIVWRMTGSGGMTLSAYGPEGRARRLAWGPERHDSSTFDRPGQEWGAAYRFDRPGCWHLRATRGTASGDVWLTVARRAGDAPESGSG